MVVKAKDSEGTWPDMFSKEKRNSIHMDLEDKWLT